MLLPDLTPWASQSKGFVHDWTIQGNDLRLTTAMANIGDGRLEIRGGAVNGDEQDVFQRIYNADGSFTDVQSGVFIYHDEHDHIHFEEFAQYRLREILPGGGVGDVIAAGEKVSFCLLDVDRYDNSGPAAPVYVSCGQQQGISVGWADVYDRGLPGQSIDITNIADGRYWLEVEVDPSNRLMETDETNNIVRIEIDLQRPGGNTAIAPDTFEANDSFDNASILAPPEDHSYTNLTIHASQNDDYFRVTASATGPLWFDLAFKHADGDIDMAVYDANRNLVGRSDSANDFENVRVDAIAGQYYYVRVFGYEGDTNRNYTFNVDQLDDHNHAPTNITLSSNAVQEFRANGTVVATLTTIDPGVGNVPTYTLLNSAGGRFTVAGNQLRVANHVLLDYEQAKSHTITLRATDRGGLTVDKTFAINVLNVEPEVVTGNSSANTLVGGVRNDALSGVAGNDVLKGGGGSDTLNGGTGIDVMIGGDGSDTFVVDVYADITTELATGGTDTVTSMAMSLNLGHHVNVENITLLGAANLSATGNAAANTLRGNIGANWLNGSGGNDFFNGGLGNDIMAGGTGNDMFVFNSAPNANTNRDTIVDFVAVNDTILLDNAVFAALGAATGTLSAASFWASATGLAHDANDRILYNKTTGALIYDSNGSAAGGAIHFATLSNHPANITAANFLVI